MRKAHEILSDTNGIGDAIRLAQKEAWNEAIEAAAENARCEVTGQFLNVKITGLVDKQSILKLKI